MDTKCHKRVTINKQSNNQTFGKQFYNPAKLNACDKLHTLVNILRA